MKVLGQGGLKAQPSSNCPWPDTKSHSWSRMSNCIKF